MADKGKRIASRQAQLKRRKQQKGRRRTDEFDAGPGESAAAPSADAVASVPVSSPEAEAAPAPTQASAEAQPAPERSVPSTRAARQSRAASRAEATATYPYLGVELQHIGAITTVLVIALIVLTFLLR